MRLLAHDRDRLAALATNARAAPRVISFELRRWRLARRHLRGSGLEIGALHRPLRVPSAVTVRYVDRFDRDALHRHYPELRDHRLVEVDIVDDGETLGSQADASADFIIANHFIEHTEDPLGALANHLRVLRPGGVLYLAVPDRRWTFDRDREGTSLEHIIEDHARGPSGSRPSHYEEWARLVERVPDADVPRRARELEARDYSIHFHVWSPAEFSALLEYAREGTRLPLGVDVLQGNGHEFIGILRRT